MARSKPANANDVRRQVLDAAVHIITTSGAETLSMREVARRASVSHQAPYHYFGDRSGILAAISAEGFIKLAAALRAAYNGTSSIENFGLSAYVNFARSNPGHFRVMFRNDTCGISTHAETAQAADEAFNELLLLVERTMGVSENEEDAMTHAVMMWSHAHGLASLALDGPLEGRLPPGTDLDTQLESVIALTAQMVANRAAALGLRPAPH